MSKAKLEERYLVIKLNYLCEGDEEFIRNNYGNCLVNAVVVEEDWPEYDPTVNLILERANEETTS